MNNNFKYKIIYDNNYENFYKEWMKAYDELYNYMNFSKTTFENTLINKKNLSISEFTETLINTLKNWSVLDFCIKISEKGDDLYEIIITKPLDSDNFKEKDYDFDINEEEINKFVREYNKNMLIERKIIKEDEEFYKDEVGGKHGCGVGYNPNGVFCGECVKSTCKDCVNANFKKEEKMEFYKVSGYDFDRLKKFKKNIFSFLNFNKEKIDYFKELFKPIDDYIEINNIEYIKKFTDDYYSIEKSINDLDTLSVVDYLIKEYNIDKDKKEKEIIISLKEVIEQKISNQQINLTGYYLDCIEKDCFVMLREKLLKKNNFIELEYLNSKQEIECIIINKKIIRFWEYVDYKKINIILFLSNSACSVFNIVLSEKSTEEFLKLINIA